MSDTPGDRHGPERYERYERYEIRFKGHLDARWADWFEGLSLACDSDGTTLLSGPVADQAALLGLLRKLRDLGLRLVSVNQANPVNRENAETEEVIRRDER